MDPAPIFLKPPQIDPAVWRPDVPLVVLERCSTKEQLSVWIAIRWLMAAFPAERGFGTRKIAVRAKVNQKYVSRWCAELIDLELLEQAGEETVAGFARARPVYTVPLRKLEQISSAMAVDVLLRWGAPLPPPPPSRAQLRLDLAEPTDPLGDQITDPLRDQSSATDPLRDQITDPLRDQTDPPEDQITDPLGDHGMDGRMDGGMDDRATPQKKKRRRGRRHESAPPSAAEFPAAPRAPAGEPPLSDHPLALWQQACADPRPIDGHQLAVLAAEHDAPTAGHGAYWVGRAILAAALNEDVRQVAKVRNILARWRRDHAYGSDLQSAPRNANERPAQSQHAPRQPGRPSPRSPGSGAPDAGKHGPTGGSDLRDPGWRERLLAEAEADDAEPDV